MKRFLGISLFVCFASTFLLARTPQEAANIASQFISQSHTTPVLRMQRAAAATTLDQPVDLVYTQYQLDKTTPAVFVFNNAKAEGFVWVSAEENARTILAYSDHGYFNHTDIPENMQFWLNMYANEIARAHSTHHHLGTSINQPLPNIEPLLGETAWGQGKPYNNLCPIINGERSVAGCVATAISQIMYAHKYPEKGSGSNTYRIGKDITISEDFSQTTYDWENMLPRYKKQYTEEQANAVATLIYHTGVASFMSYHPQGSGAVSEWAMQAINTYFGYDAAVKPLLKDYMLEYDILSTVANELQEGRPIYISGRTTNEEGHAFVCDGIHSDGFIHINWGWDGSGDGFYALSALDPGQHGTGGSSTNLAFTEDVTLYTNIRPDQGGEAQPYIYATATQTSKARIARKDKVQFKLEYIGDAGTMDIDGHIGYYIYDAQQNLVEQIPLQRIKLRPGYIYTEIHLSSAIASNLENATYSMVIASADANGIVRPVLLRNQGYPEYTFTLTSDSIFFDVQEIQMPTAMQADWINKSGTNQWQMNLYSPDFWQDTTAMDEWLIQCTFTSNSHTSLIGTYLLNKTSNTPGNINMAGAICAIGNASDCKQYTLQDLQLTIAEHNTDSLCLQYTLTFNGKTYTQTFLLPKTNWYQEQDGEYHPYSDSVTYQLATPLPASAAIAISKKYLHPDASPIDYLVEGGIAILHHTPAEIKEQQYADFEISDDGDISKTLHCAHIQWLNQAPYTTGEEIHASDTVVIYGKLSFVDNTPQMQGYIYQHLPSVQMPITNFQFSTEGMQMTATWESEAPYFKLRLYDKNNKVVADNTTNKLTITAKMPQKGEYTFYLRPMLANKIQFAGAPVIHTFVAGASTDLQSITSQQQGVLYDIMGNKMGVIENGDIQSLNGTLKGVYILVGESSSKIFIP